MASITSITGITKSSANVYLINDDGTHRFVNIGVIDEPVIVAATFIVKNGILRFVDGCTTTFIDCTFIDVASTDGGVTGCWALGNEPPSEVDRFEHVPGCAPVFKGCKWIIERGIGRTNALIPGGNVGTGVQHDFLPSNKSSVKFLANDEGTYCRVTIENFNSATEYKDVNGTLVYDPQYVGNDSFYTKTGVRSPYSPALVSPDFEMNGFIFDAYGTSWSYPKTQTINELKNIITVDNDGPDYVSNHASVSLAGIIGGGWDGVSWVIPIRNLSARSFGVYCQTTFPEYLNPNIYAKLINPVGHLAKAPYDGIPNNDSRGLLKCYRTLDIDYFSPETDTVLEDVRTVIFNANTSEKIYDVTSGVVSTELFQFQQDWDSYVEEYDNQYSVIAGKYGYKLISNNLTIEDLPQGGGYTFNKRPLFKDLEITNTDINQISSLTEITKSSEIYDYMSYYFLNTDSYFLSNGISGFVSKVGSDLVISEKNVVLYPSLTSTVFVTDANATGGLPVIQEYSSTLNPAELSHLQDFQVSTFDFTTVGINNVTDYKFNDDGTICLIIGAHPTVDVANYKIFRLDLTIPYDLTTAVLDPNTHGTHWSTPYVAGRIYRFIVNAAGTMVGITTSQASWFYTYTMSTPWTPSSMNLSPQYYGVESNCNVSLSKEEDLIVLTGGRNIDPARLYFIPLSTPGNFRSHGVASGQSLSSYLYTVTITDQQNRYFKGTIVPDIGYLLIRTTYDNVIQFNINDITNTTFDWAASYNADTTYNNPDIAGYGYASTVYPDMADVITVNSWYQGTDLYLSTLDSNYQVITYSYPATIVEASVVGGEPNTLYLKASNIIPDAGISRLVITDGTYEAVEGAGTSLIVKIGTTTVTSLTIKGINPNTEIRVYKVSDGSEVLSIESTTGYEHSFNYAYNSADVQEWNIVIHNTDYITSPSVISFTTQEAPAIVSVFQQRDRAFRN